MFYTYLKLFARHATWLEKRFPKYMLARRYTFNYSIGQLLRVPSVIFLIFLPMALIVWLVFKLPIDGAMQVLLILVLFFIFMGLLLRAFIRELRGRKTI